MTKKLLYFLLLIFPIILSSKEVGIFLEEKIIDGKKLACHILFDGEKEFSLDEIAKIPSPLFYPETGLIWVDRNHRYAIVQSIDITDDGMGIFAYWDLNDERASFYRTIGSNLPIWEYPGSFYWNYGGHSIGTSYNGSGLVLSSLSSCYYWNKNSSFPVWIYNYPTSGGGISKISYDGNYVASATINGDLFLFDKNGNLIWQANFSEGNRLQGLDISNDGSVVVVTVYDSCFIFENGRRRGALPIGTANVGTQYAAKISADGRLLVTGDYYGYVKLYYWDGSRYRLKWQSLVGNPWVTDVAISKDGSTIVCGTGYANGKIVVFDSSSSTPLWSYQGYGSYGAMISSVALSYNGSFIAATSWGDTAQTGSFYVFTLHHKSSNIPITGITRNQEPGSLFACDISSDGSYATCGGKAVHAYRFGNGGQVYSITIRRRPKLNVGTTKILSPHRHIRIGETFTPQAQFYNFGDSTVNFYAYFVAKVNDSILRKDSLFITSLGPNSSRIVNFSNFTPSFYNYYNFLFYTHLIGDTYHYDDSLLIKSKCFHDAEAKLINPPFSEMTIGYTSPCMLRIKNNGSYSDSIKGILIIRDSLNNEIYIDSAISPLLQPEEEYTLTLRNFTIPYVGPFKAEGKVRLNNDFIPNNDTISKNFIGSYEIIYDDGFPEAYYWVGRLNNDKFYVKFTPTLTPPFSITTGRVMVNIANTPFDYILLCKDENGRPDTANPLARVENISAPIAPAWADFTFNVNIYSLTDLWVVLHWPNNSPPLGVGADANEPRDYRSYWSSNLDTFQLWRYHDWMIRITQSPQVVITENLIKEKRKVFIFSNPFSKKLTIKFSISFPEDLTIKIYDIKGNLIDKIIKTNLKPGEYNFQWQNKKISQGVYLIELNSKSVRYKEKIIYLK
ncbi:MAG: T9SS type A sorting domain-containing protein [candidate division WOR-3 bacterium]|nr:T9SS type A sorting domain-containing protein [candidate division WOR-3 bacterium]MCX7836338.1 T9SS type A sorting domain-containing protein [candidate division WOR-3 bacterium]MDW8113557.1 T9SS type A sorting domain-containing protein [candidate division WOR-3 bacterium]